MTISWEDRGVGDHIRGTGHRDVIQGGPRSEHIEGEGGDDVICGGPGDDLIDGGADADELRGEAERDTFGGSPDTSTDILIGGGGRDYAIYERVRAALTINLRSGTVVAQGARKRGGIHGVEVVRGSKYDDHLVGDSLENKLAGEGGNDFIDGLGGKDHLDGGPGLDEVSYFSAQDPVELELARFALVGRGEHAERDDLFDFEIAFGSDFDDELTGTSDREVLHGGEGDDVIKGRGDRDGLAGGAGDDVLFPGPGDDKVDGGPNDPVTSAGEHGDLVSYQPDETTDSPDDYDDRPDNLEANLATVYAGPFVFPPGATGVGEDVFGGLESVRGTRDQTSSLSGTEGPNVIIGGRKFDNLEGLGGNDLLYGMGSGDAISGGDGDDYLDGGGAAGDESSEDGSTGTDILYGDDGNDTCVDGWSYNECEAGDPGGSRPFLLQ